MSRKDILFERMAREILTNSLKREIDEGNEGLLLYEEFVSKASLEFKNLTPVPKKNLLVFYRGERDIFSIQKLNIAIKVTINAKFGTLKDTKKLMRNVSKLGHWGNGDYQIKLENKTYFDDILGLIKQIY
jgi:predicted transport protein